MDKIAATLWITFGLYMLVLVAILADLWSGLRKAKRNGEVRTSFGFKRTIDKVAKYYNALIMLSVIDAMQMSALWYLEQYYQVLWPMFPFVTLFGAIGICLVEVKSIYEKAEDKTRIDNVVSVAGKVIKNKKDATELIESILDYLKSIDNDKN